MAGGSMKLDGFKELHDTLGQFKKGTERAILRRTATKALAPFVERAKQLAPVDDGHLRDSIVIGNSLTKNARREAKRDPVQGVRVFAGTSDRNGVPREYGTWRTQAQPFMRPAFDATKDQMLDIVKVELRADIEKTAKRVKKGK